MSQEEWLDRYDLIEDDWYSNPPSQPVDEASGSGFEEGEFDEIHHSEL